MPYPDEVLRIARDASRKYPDDIDTATNVAEREVRRLDCFADLVDQLVRSTVRALICDYRHHDNRILRKARGQYGGPAKVVSGDSKAVQQIAMTVYEHRIAGMTLGNLLGEQLLPIANSEATRADGHKFNAILCRKLSVLVDAQERVRDVVPESKLVEIFRAAQREATAVVKKAKRRRRKAAEPALV